MSGAVVHSRYTPILFTRHAPYHFGGSGSARFSHARALAVGSRQSQKFGQKTSSFLCRMAYDCYKGNNQAHYIMLKSRMSTKFNKKGGKICQSENENRQQSACRWI